MESDKALFERAQSAAKSSYSPYSKVRVGAALETDDGKIFEGCNMENASYGLTICAERGALLAMVRAGGRKVRRIAVCVVFPAGVSGPQVPCGACLQCLAEFADDDAKIIVGPASSQRLAEFFPQPFRLTP